MNESVISVEALSKTFKTVRALDTVTFDVPAGSVFGFLGPNGAGKTTTIRLLLGLLEPAGGSARIFGYDVTSQGAEVRSRTGALLEHHGLYERLTAEDNLDYYARIWRIPAQERKHRVSEVLKHFGLADRRRARAGTLSRGMKQKLAIARVLVHRPKLIFLDEPTSGLDPIAAASLRDDIARLTVEEGVTVFMSTHNLHEAERLCDTVAVLNRGKLVAYGAPDTLLAKDGTTTYRITGSGFTTSVLTTLGTIPDVMGHELADSVLKVRINDRVGTTGVLRALITSGASIDEVHRDKASLEDTFLALMEDNNDQ